MKTLIAISALAMGATLGMQSPSQAPGGLTKVAPPPLQTQKGGSAQTLDAWREQLTDTNLGAREQVFDRVIAAARRDASLRQALRDWSSDNSAGELAWTARLALRELNFARSGAFGFPGLDLPGFDLSTPFDPNEFFQQFDSNWPDANDPHHPLGAPGNSSSSIESFSLSMGSDGVKCTVKRNIDGKEETQEYTAESIDKLLEAHPELRDQLHGGDALNGWGAGGPGRSGHLLRVDPFHWFSDSATPDSSPVAPQGIAPLRTDVLGVRVQPLTQEQSQQLDLEPGVGLRIDSTDPGTIARTMGLQAGHILIEMNGRKLKSRDDITEELKKRGADGQIECVAIDRWGQHRTYTWKPDPGRQL